MFSGSGGSKSRLAKAAGAETSGQINVDMTFSHKPEFPVAFCDSSKMQIDHGLDRTAAMRLSN